MIEQAPNHPGPEANPLQRRRRWRTCQGLALLVVVAATVVGLLTMIDPVPAGVAGGGEAPPPAPASTTTTSPGPAASGIAPAPTSPPPAAEKARSLPAGQRLHGLQARDADPGPGPPLLVPDQVVLLDPTADQLALVELGRLGGSGGLYGEVPA